MFWLILADDNESRTSSFSTTAELADPIEMITNISGREKCEKDFYFINRPKWRNKFEYYLCTFALCASQQSVYSLPFIFLYYGGIAFLIPLLVFAILGSIPMFFLQSTIGQMTNAGFITFYNICPILKGLGYATLYFNFVHSLTTLRSVMDPFHYLIQTFGKEIPWKNCDNQWNTAICGIENGTRSLAVDEFYHNKYLRETDSSDQSFIVEFSFVSAIMITWLLVGILNLRSIHWIGKAVTATVLLPFTIMFVCGIWALSLPGAIQGLNYFLLPDWRRLGNIQPWIAAVNIQIQMFGTGGTLQTLASYNKPKNNNSKDLKIFPVFVAILSIIPLIFISAFAGHAASISSRSLHEMRLLPNEFFYVELLKVLETFKFSPLWMGLLFFQLFLFQIGIKATFLDALIRSIVDEWPNLEKKRINLVPGLCMVLSVVSLCTNEIFIKRLPLTIMSPVLETLILFIQLMLIVWSCGQVQLRVLAYKILGRLLSLGWFFIWKFICPVIILFIVLIKIGDVATDFHRNSFIEIQLYFNFDLLALIFALVYGIRKVWKIEGLSIWLKFKSACKQKNFIMYRSYSSTAEDGDPEKFLMRSYPKQIVRL